ncbi:MAG: thioesterase family protein [Anaerolineae bacterium]
MSAISHVSTVIETQIRVRYAETDQGGIVYNANYLIWFEVARGEFFWQRGLDFGRDVEARGLFWPVTEAGLRYIAPAHYGELVTVRAWVKEIKSRQLTIQYEVSRDGQLLCTGFTKHLNVDRSGRVVPIPQDLRDLMLK